MSCVKQSPALRLLLIFLLSLCLMIPMFFVMNLIQERQNRREQVIAEINFKWSTSQTLTGPILVVPYESVIKAEKKGERDRTVILQAFFLPDTLAVSGWVHAQPRYRSIYETVVYDSDLTIRGAFSKPDFEKLNISPSRIRWEEVRIGLGISDMKGIEEAVDIDWDGIQCPGEPADLRFLQLQSGIQANVPCTDERNTFLFKIDLKLKGSEQLQFTPTGRTTHVSLQGDWPKPSFVGEFLPDERNVNAKGFSAEWDVLHLNRSFPQQWTDDIKWSARFGVKLLLAMSQYQEAMRSAKYALLFVLLTYSAVFFTEIFTRRTLHPVQYVFIGISLVLFYLLLLSLSEHMGFDLAYGFASLATIALVGSYTKVILGGLRPAGVISGTLSALYGFYYVLLQLQDYALLTGSLGLFAILAVLMYLTRRVDWYTAFNNKNGKEFSFSKRNSS